MSLLMLYLLVFSSSLLLTLFYKVYAKKYGVMDIPNQRNMHKQPVPRGAGISVAIVFLFVVLFFFIEDQISHDFFYGVFFGGLLVSIVGLIDDHRHVSPIVRIIIHIGAASLLFFTLPELPELYIFDSKIDSIALNYVIFTVITVWVVNLFNFMDGIDGLSGVELISVSIAMAFIITGNSNNGGATDGGEIVLFSLLISLAVACAGFLTMNWSPAKVFLGDVGSGFLGFTIASIAVYTIIYDYVTFWPWLIMLGVFVSDTSFTLIRRILSGQRWYSAHRTHAYQYAAIKFNSHAKVSLSVLAINCLWLFPLAWVAQKNSNYGFLITVIAYAPLSIILIHFNAGTEMRKNDSAE